MDKTNRSVKEIKARIRELTLQMALRQVDCTVGVPEVRELQEELTRRAK